MKAPPVSPFGTPRYGPIQKLTLVLSTVYVWEHHGPAKTPHGTTKIPCTHYGPTTEHFHESSEDPPCVRHGTMEELLTHHGGAMNSPFSHYGPTIDPPSAHHQPIKAAPLTPHGPTTDAIWEHHGSTNERSSFHYGNAMEAPCWVHRASVVVFVASVASMVGPWWVHGGSLVSLWALDMAAAA